MFAIIVNLIVCEPLIFFTIVTNVIYFNSSGGVKQIL